MQGKRERGLSCGVPTRLNCELRAYMGAAQCLQLQNIDRSCATPQKPLQSSYKESPFARINDYSFEKWQVNFTVQTLVFTSSSLQSPNLLQSH